jgi:hypothetical protein
MDDCDGRVQDEGTQAVITFFQNCPRKIAILYVTRSTTKLEALGFIGARNKIRSFIRLAITKRIVVVESPNVSRINCFMLLKFVLI